MKEPKTPEITLTEFLLARIAEDEAWAERGGWFSGPGDFAYDNYGDLLVKPSRVLAECEAKRRIVERHLEAQAYEVEAYSVPVELTGYCVSALALPYADHPDYRDEWRA